MKLISLETAGERTEHTARTIRRWIELGLIAGYKLGPQSVRVDEDELDRFIRGGRIPCATWPPTPSAAKATVRKARKHTTAKS